MEGEISALPWEGYNGWARPLGQQVPAHGWRLFNVNNLKLPPILAWQKTATFGPDIDLADVDIVEAARAILALDERIKALNERIEAAAVDCPITQRLRSTPGFGVTGLLRSKADPGQTTQSSDSSPRPASDPCDLEDAGTESRLRARNGQRLKIREGCSGLVSCLNPSSGDSASRRLLDSEMSGDLSAGVRTGAILLPLAPFFVVEIACNKTWPLLLLSGGDHLIKSSPPRRSRP